VAPAGVSFRGSFAFVLAALATLYRIGMRRRRLLAVLGLAIASACAMDDETAGEDATTTDAASSTSVTSTTSTTGGGGEGGNANAAQALLDALGTSVWSGLQTRDGKERVYELRFDAESLLWAEIQNPYGPARHREMRSFTVLADGTSVESTVITPAGWPADENNGREDSWTLEILEGSPRTLRTTRDGVTEEYTEGEWPAPTTGLTATARVFSSSGLVDNAFCSSGLNGFDYPTFLDFARGKSAEPVLASDVVAGAHLVTWHDGTGLNQFAITNVDGFDLLGGTEMTDQFNFFVQYLGVLSHPGGDLSMRELDDTVEDGVWVFLGDSAVGSNNTNDILLQVHGFVWSDDETVTTNLPAGDYPIEIIVARCSVQISDVDVEIALGGGPFQLVGDAPTTPEINTTLFPPAL
jgi:hypothetical protein